MYIGQVPSRHTMRMFTEPGRRVPAHCTGVGKALLSQLPDDAVRELLARTGMPAATPNTITDPDDDAGRAGARSAARATPWTRASRRSACAASPSRCTGALGTLGISVSGPAPRMTPELIDRAVPLLRKAGERLSSEIGERSTA